MDKWISCADRLPEEKGRYIIYHWYMDAVQINYWDGEKWEYGHRATHWMPLPPKPEGSTEAAISLGIAMALPEELK